MPDIVTPAGIRYTHRIHEKSKHGIVIREELKGLTYIVKNKGPVAAWLKTIGRSKGGTCRVCEEGAAQNLRQCTGVGGGKRRSIEQAYEDVE